MFLQKAGVFMQRVHPLQGHAPVNPPLKSGRLVLGKINLTEVPQKRENLLQPAVIGGGEEERFSFPRARTIRMPHQSQQLARNLARRQDEIHIAGGNGAVRHPAELG